MAGGIGGYTWDFRVARYRGPDGRLVSRLAVRDALDRAILALRNQARANAASYRAGSISLDEWEASMRQIVKDTHLLNTVAARGGFDQMTDTEYGRIGAVVREQYAYLDQFTAGIANGAVPLDGRFDVRAAMYADAGRGTYEGDVAAQQQEVGATEERSVLHPADHCEDCLAEAAKGWQPLGTLIPIQQRQCLTNDACTMDYR